MRTGKTDKRKDLSNPVVAAPKPELPEQTRIASRIANKRVRDRMEAGQERVQMAIRTTGHNSTTRDAVGGMTEDVLLVRLADAMGTTSPSFIDEILAQLLTVFGKTTDHRNSREINAALAVLDGMKPENEVEAMLIAQMIATNDAAMKSLAQIGKGLNAEIYGNLGVKLLRTFTAQTEALAKLRRKGEQTVRVVHVHSGAQAVVGDVHHHSKAGGGTAPENEGQPHGARELTPRPALPCQDPSGNGVPIAGDAERAMPHSRGTVARRAPRKSQRLEARPMEPRDDPAPTRAEGHAA